MNKVDYNSNELLRLEKLGCIRANLLLFEPVSFSLACGESLHLQAANGVGKTTLLRAIYGLAIETVGTIFWQNKSIRNLTGLCIYLNDSNGYIAHLTACEALEKMMLYAGTVTDKNRIKSLLVKLGLRNPNCLASNLSRGQKRRLHLARLILSKKKLWLLDEPYDGLDTDGKNLLNQLIDDQLANDGAIIFTSHMVDNSNDAVEHYHSNQRLVLETVIDQ